MRFFNYLLFILLSSILLPAAANINSHFEAIKSNPKALYAFFKEMPKGGELHYHLAGGAHTETLMNLATQGDYCLNPKTHTITTATLCDGIKTATLAAKTNLYQQVINAWSMNDAASGKKSDHDHFFETFLKFMPIVLDYRPQLLAEIMKRAAVQHELYLEIQILPDNANSATFGQLHGDSTNYAAQQQRLLANKKFQTNIHHTITESTRILQQARHHLGCESSPQQAVCTLTVKFQYYILREQPITHVFAQALNGFAAAAQSKDIVGVNLVQAEDGMISMRDYQQQMRIFNYLHTRYPTVNIALHAGELAPHIGQLGQQSTHIHDAIFTGHASRIGHGANIAAEKNAKKLLQHMQKSPIPVEINLTSNRKILGVKGRAHPLNYYLNHQIPVVLSTDDEGILRTDLTHEYVDAVRSHHLDYPTIKNINRNALTYSFLPGKSLWAFPEKELTVPECQNFRSLSCQNFIQKNPKAQLQLQLETQLAVFEMAHSSN